MTKVAPQRKQYKADEMTNICKAMIQKWEHVGLLAQIDKTNTSCVSVHLRIRTSIEQNMHLIGQSPPVSF